MSTETGATAAIEMAAKYICNHHCGRCPMVVVNFPCPAECGLDTMAWHCWIEYFRNLADKVEVPSDQKESADEGASLHKAA